MPKQGDTSSSTKPALGNDLLRLGLQYVRRSSMGQAMT
jgi:hypothetical protein